MEYENILFCVVLRRFDMALYLVFVAAGVICIMEPGLANTILPFLCFVGGFIVTCVYVCFRKDDDNFDYRDYINQKHQQDIDEENEYGIIKDDKRQK